MARALRRRTLIGVGFLAAGVLILVAGGLLALTHRGDTQPKTAYLVLVVGGFVTLSIGPFLPLAIRSTRRSLAAARGGSGDLGVRLAAGPSTIARGRPLAVELAGSVSDSAVEVGLVRVRGRRSRQTVVDPNTGLSTSGIYTRCEVEWQEWEPIPPVQGTFTPPPTEPPSYENENGCVWWSLRARPAGEGDPQQTVLLRAIWVEAEG